MDKKTFEGTLSFTFLQVARAYRQRAQQMLSDVGLHIGQDLILMHLWHKDGLTMSEIVEQVAKQPATITKMVNRMEKSGLVERRPDPDDGRVKRIYMTDMGRDVWEQTLVAWQRLNDESSSNLTDDEQETLKHLLLKMRAGLVPENEE